MLEADQCIRYLSKYLTKSIGDSLDGGQAKQQHATRMLDALRYEPCSPACPNWLRYGVQPKNAKPGMLPGRCRSKAHKPEHLRLRRTPRPRLPQVEQQDPR
ncbi:replication initiator [Nonomuraea sp. NPDC048881]|uniref:replication initiator n=1 Tax=Nonomuraea sp. NPDC048881 TaxID=3155030 RepID=UPI0033EAA6E4